jgi:hypothetical protein
MEPIMKKNIFKSALIVFAFISLFNFFNTQNLLVANAHHTTPTTPEQAAQQLAEGSPIEQPGDIFKILTRIVQYVYTIFFVVAVIFIIIAAFNFLTGGDNPEKIKGAQKQILWAAVAIAIALLSLGAAQIIKNLITP